MERAAIENTEDYIIEYHRTGKELLEEFDSYCMIISQYCREQQEWIRVSSIEYKKLISRRVGRKNEE